MVSTARLLTVYLAVREISAALGFTSLGGHPSIVRPLVAPMAEAAAETRHPKLPDATRYRIRAIRPKVAMGSGSSRPVRSLTTSLK